MKQIFVLLALVITLAGGLAGCLGPLGKPRDNRALSNRETCVAGCNRDSAVCNDEPASNREALQGTGRTLNANRECQLGLGACLDRCKGL